jgi:hypothetical protein
MAAEQIMTMQSAYEQLRSLEQHKAAAAEERAEIDRRRSERLIGEVRRLRDIVAELQEAAIHARTQASALEKAHDERQQLISRETEELRDAEIQVGQRIYFSMAPCGVHLGLASPDRLQIHAM